MKFFFKNQLIFDKVIGV